MRAMPPSIANRNTVWYVLKSFAKTGPVAQTRCGEKRGEQPKGKHELIMKMILIHMKKVSLNVKIKTGVC